MDDWRKRDLAIGRPRADLDTFLKNLVKLREWEYPVIDNLKGERYRGLSELRWKSGRTPHRIFGYHQGELEKMGIRLTQVAPISCGLGIFLGSVTG